MNSHLEPTAPRTQKASLLQRARTALLARPWTVKSLVSIFGIVAIVGLVLLQRHGGLNSLPVWLAIIAFLSICLFIATALVFMYAPIERIQERWSELVFHLLLALIAGTVIVSATSRSGSLTFDEFTEALAVAGVIFAVGIVGRAGEAVDTILRNVSRLEDATDQAKDLGEAARLSMKAVAEARFSGLAARVLEIKEEALHRESKRNKDGLPSYDEGIVEGVEPGIDALKAWIVAGDKAGKAFPTDKHFVPSLVPEEGARTWADAARQAWWRAMQVYHKEEIYDISRREIATNIRNYAFMLLAVMSEFLRTVKDANRKCKGDPSKRLQLVVANISCFAPKDFYNYPDGAQGNRFYHETEFFGTYRRALACVLRDPNVHPLRIVLASHGDQGPDSDSTLGWPLDSVTKLALDCARFRVIPWPITDKTVGGPPDGDFERSTTITPGKIGVHFRKGRNPAERLPARTDRYLWAPTSVEFNGFAERGDAFRRMWLDNALLCEPEYKGGADDLKKTRLAKVIGNLQVILDAYLGADSKCSLELRMREALSALHHLFLESCERDPAADGSLLDDLNGLIRLMRDRWPTGLVDYEAVAEIIDRERKFSGLDGILGNLERRDTVLRCLASLASAEECEHRLRFLTYCDRDQTVRSAASELIHWMRKTWPSGSVDYRELMRSLECEERFGDVARVVNTFEHNDSVPRFLVWVSRDATYGGLLGAPPGDPRKNPDVRSLLTHELLAFVEECHKIDSLITTLWAIVGNDGDREKNVNGEPSARPEVRRLRLPVTGATGEQLGAAENWLHRTLAHHEGIGTKHEIERAGKPLPLWHLLISDLCGVCGEPAPEKPTAANLKENLMPRFRVCAIRKREEAEGGGPGFKYKPLTESGMLERNILPEFLMVGVVEASRVEREKQRHGTDGDIDEAKADEHVPGCEKSRSLVDDVRWLALVGAEMSQPLHTCRVEVRFAHGGCTDSQCGGAVCRHKRWLAEAWTAEEVTAEFINQVEKESSEIESGRGQQNK